jgi:hypothetical protein
MPDEESRLKLYAITRQIVFGMISFARIRTFYSCFQTYTESRNFEIVMTSVCTNGSGGKTPKLPIEICFKFPYLLVVVPLFSAITT